MVGLGTIFIAILVLAALAAVARTCCFDARRMLWMLMLALPFPLHRQHGRLDDRGARTAAVADLRSDAHDTRVFRRWCRRETRGSR